MFPIIHLILRMKQDQKELPEELFAVKMYALVTSQPKIQNSGKRRRPKNSPRMIRSWKMPVQWADGPTLLSGHVLASVKVSRTSVLLCSLNFVSYTFYFLYKLKFSLRSIFSSKCQLMLYHLATDEIHDLCGVHVHVILRGMCWSSESNACLLHRPIS
jgi:hypothetical protein